MLKDILYCSAGVIAIVLVIGIRGYNEDLFVGRIKYPKIPQAYFDDSYNDTYVFDEDSPSIYITTGPLGCMPPYKHPSTGDKTLWRAYTCTNPDCQGCDEERPIIFPKIFKLPDDVTPPDEGEMPSPEFEEAMMEATMEPPKCPLCKKMDYSIEFQTKEAKAIIKDLQEKIKSRRKKKKIVNKIKKAVLN
jgi:hypothetical protein